jgi:hypothetical protein
MSFDVPPIALALPKLRVLLRGTKDRRACRRRRIVTDVGPLCPVLARPSRAAQAIVTIHRHWFCIGFASPDGRDGES